MRMLIERKDRKEIFKVLRREGSKDPELYVQVLSFLVQQTMADDETDGDNNDEDEYSR